MSHEYRIKQLRAAIRLPGNSQKSYKFFCRGLDIRVAQAVVYLSMAPKSNALYAAYENCKEDAVKMLAEPVPLQIRNAPTRLMEELHYGEGYIYAHNTEEKVTAMRCLPDSLKDKRYYVPTGEGKEAEVKEKLDRILQWKREQENKKRQGNKESKEE